MKTAIINVNPQSIHAYLNGQMFPIHQVLLNGTKVLNIDEILIPFSSDEVIELGED